MTKQFFTTVICFCITATFSPANNGIVWEDGLNERLRRLGEDQDIINRFPNLTIHVFYYNFTQDESSGNETNDSKCNATDEATRCSEVDIFEVAKSLPPTTQYLEITNSPVSVLGRSVLSNLTSLTHLKLTNNSIQYIISKFFIGLDNLRILDLSSNNIRSLLSKTLSGCPNIVSLDLSKNRIISLTFLPAALAPLKNLITLNLSRNNIRAIRQNDLAMLARSPLQYLDFSYCNLTRIEKGSFSHLGSLEVLIMKVTHINEEALFNVTYNLPSLQVLDLRLLPALRAFPSEAMMHLANSSIEFLDFSLNEFSLIPSTSFPPLPTLKRLKFFSSAISTIEDGAFNGLSSLEFLDLSANRLSAVPSSISALKNLLILNLASQKKVNFAIPDYSLSNLTSLKLLRLEKNKIKSVISQLIFYGLNNLTMLLAYDCEIVSIKKYAFRELTSLELLEFSYNNIFSLHNESFYGLSNLKTLGLRNNGLFVGFNSRPFQHTKSLEKLDLQGNKLKFLRTGMFSGMKRLKYLNLSENGIVPWDDPLFETATPKRLLLAQNDISHVTPAMLEDFKRVSSIDLSSNPFDCRHCRITEFHEFLLGKNLSLLDNKGNSYNCFSPPNLYGHSIFESDFPLDHCFPPPFSLEVRVAIGFTTVAALTITLTIIGYYFRWYFRYWWFHLHASMKRLSSKSERSAYVYDAFVSYNSADISWVTRKLIPNLENHNSQIRLCLHDRDFEVGRLITENILECIDKSRKVLLVLTNSFAKSEWCLFELHVAQHRLFHDTRDELVLIQVEALRKEEISKHLRYLMNTRTLLVWPDTPDKEEAFWTNLHRVLSS